MRALLLVTLLAACSKSNPYYCPGHPDDNCLLDADPNAPQGCKTSDDCMNADKPICEPKDKVCVACTETMVGACGGTMPLCSPTNTCTPCSDHGQCDSQACLPTGACGDDTNVAYVAATGDDAAACGTRAAPCKTITAAATKSKPYVKVQTDLDEAVAINAANVTILAAPGTAVRRSTQGEIFNIRGASTVTIYDLTIREALGSIGHGIYVSPGEPVNLALERVNIVKNTGIGIFAQGTSLTMSRCVVSGNMGGGGNVATSFNISNSLFVRNGGPSSNIGGLQLSPAGTVSFKFNTVANNGASGAIVGINCIQPVTSTNTIVSGNNASPSCTFEYSLFDATTNVSGTNRAGDPQFRNADPANPFAPNYYRIQPGSEAIDRGDPTSTMATDIDGDSRPQGSAPDIGADEQK